MMGRERAPHGDRIVANLWKTLNLGVALLYQVAKFRRALPSLYSCANLSWTHYRTIITLPTLEQRTFYERAANENRWTVDELQARIEIDTYGAVKNRPFDGRPLTAR
jgi:hypothetical protein